MDVRYLVQSLQFGGEAPMDAEYRFLDDGSYGEAVEDAAEVLEDDSVVEPLLA